MNHAKPFSPVFSSHLCQLDPYRDLASRDISIRPLRKHMSFMNGYLLSALNVSFHLFNTCLGSKIIIIRKPVNFLSVSTTEHLFYISNISPSCYLNYCKLSSNRSCTISLDALVSYTFSSSSVAFLK